MSTARIIDGKAHAAGLRERVTAEVVNFKARFGGAPGLAVVLVGEDPASAVYVRNKGEQTSAAGMRSYTHRLDRATSGEQLLALVERLNADDAVDGILVQLPLPAHLDATAILSAIDPDKDVDGFHVVNAGRLATGQPALTPCTPLGCLRLLRAELTDLGGARAVVIGRSNIVGKPLAHLLLAADCTVTVAHSHTRDLPALCREADILIAAIGRPRLVRGDWIRPGATVIDVGINRVSASDPAMAASGRTRLVGDVAFDEASAVASAITPVPGGVGPMTIACLLENTVRAACLRRRAAVEY